MSVNETPAKSWYAGLAYADHSARRYGVARSKTLPLSLEQFPADLANPALKYSGIYGDGWLKKESYAVLAGGAGTDLRLIADVSHAPGGQHLRVLVNRRQVASRDVPSGHFELRLPLAASRSPRWVQLRWTAAPSIGATDVRPAAALLLFLGVIAPESSAGKGYRVRSEARAS